MKLECSKKLLDYLKIKPQKTVSEGPADPLFAWTANLILINRRKTVVVVNQAFRCLFVLYGITAKSIPVLPALILDGIRGMLKSEYVRPDIIERYLDDCGREITFTANSSRSVAALCTKACKRVSIYSDLFAKNDMFQQTLLPWFNDELIPGETYRYAPEVLMTQLQERYGEAVVACRAVELEVTLELQTPCKRTLVVPADLNFYQLHRILQGAFEWHDCHLHQFILERDENGSPSKIIGVTDEDQDAFDEFMHVTRLDSVEYQIGTVMQMYTKIEYEYDFGDGWMHTVLCKGFIDDCEVPYPHCLEAIGDAPMEDSGGPSGFAEIMKVMNDPAHLEHREVCDWVRGTWWRPVNLKLINARIKHKHRVSMPVALE